MTSPISPGRGCPTLGLCSGGSASQNIGLCFASQTIVCTDFNLHWALPHISGKSPAAQTLNLSMNLSFASQIIVQHLIRARQRGTRQPGARGRMATGRVRQRGTRNGAQGRVGHQGAWPRSARLRERGNGARGNGPRAGGATRRGATGRAATGRAATRRMAVRRVATGAGQRGTR